MNETNPPATPHPRKTGVALILLGLVLAVAGPVFYAIQMQNKSLLAPWYFPVLATLGTLSIAMSLWQCRTRWRWGIAGLTTAYAALIWLILLFGLATPPYTGPVTVGQAFPHFETSLASGSPFRQIDLQSDEGTVLVFFRGRW